MVEPQNTEEEEKKAQKKSRQAWLTAVGFQVTGLQNSTESHHRDFSHPPIKELKEVCRGPGVGVHIHRALSPPDLSAPNPGVDRACAVCKCAEAHIGSREVELGQAPSGL